MNSRSEAFSSENTESNGSNEALHDVDDHTSNNLKGSIEGIIILYQCFMLILVFIWYLIFGNYIFSFTPNTSVGTHCFGSEVPYIDSST